MVRVDQASVPVAQPAGRGAYNLPANAAFMRGVPAHRRGQAFGLVSVGLVAGQGISIGAARGFAGLLGSVTGAIALAGAGGTIVAIYLARAEAGTDSHTAASTIRKASS
jgi:hypothetical protein